MDVLTVNVGAAREVAHSGAPGNLSGIDKRPFDGPVAVAAPGPKGSAMSALSGDFVADTRHHGGDDQAVYAVAREDLDSWGRELGREFDNGSFGENLTTRGVRVNDARIGERWRLGDDLVLEVSAPRIPCRVFAEWLGERGWVKRFTERAEPGCYLRVVEPGAVRAGDPIEVLSRPGHEVSVSFAFRALTREPELLPRLLAAGEALHPEARRNALKRTS